MKTSELKKIVEDNGYTFIKNEFGIEVRSVRKELMLSMNTNDTIYVGEGFCFETKKIKDVMKALIEYSETPIEERKDEKKYYFKCFLRARFTLKLLKTDENFFLNETVHSYFTQSEIDNFPPEIKDAIGCGFLKKVEVEE